MRISRGGCRCGGCRGYRGYCSYLVGTKIFSPFYPLTHCLLYFSFPTLFIPSLLYYILLSFLFHTFFLHCLNSKYSIPYLRISHLLNIFLSCPQFPTSFLHSFFVFPSTNWFLFPSFFIFFSPWISRLFLSYNTVHSSFFSLFSMFSMFHPFLTSLCFPAYLF